VTTTKANSKFCKTYSSKYLLT